MAFFRKQETLTRCAHPAPGCVGCRESAPANTQGTRPPAGCPATHTPAPLDRPRVRYDYKAILGVSMLVICFTVFSAAAIIGILRPDRSNAIVTFAAIFAMVVLSFVAIRVGVASDHRIAKQSDQTLTLASRTLGFMRQGLNQESAQAVCQLLLPEVAASAVAVEKAENVEANVGQEEERTEGGRPNQTQENNDTFI